METRMRQWRKTNKRGVSPIIATILLVAITVVLAAVLYVLISGLTKGPGNTPLGTAFAWGSPSTITGAAPGCAATHVCYSLEIASASSGLTGGALTFSARTASGGSVALTGTFTLVSAAGSGTGNPTWIASGACTNAATPVLNCTTPLASGMTLVLDSGATTGSPLSGDTIVAIGGGSFSGEVTSGSLT